MKLLSSHDSILKFLIVIVVSVLLVVNIFSYFQIQKLLESNRWVIHTYKVIDSFDKILLQVTQIESMQRGYVLTGNYVQIQAYPSVLKSLKENINTAESLIQDNPAQITRINELLPLIEGRLGFASHVIDVRKNQGENAARDLILTQQGLVLSNQIINTVDAIEEEEYLLLKTRAEAFYTNEQLTSVIIIIANILATLILFITLILRNSLLSRHLNIEKQLQKRNHEITLLGQLGNVLQSCSSIEEIYQPIATYCRQILPFAAGVLYFMNPSRNYLQSVAEWNSPVMKEETFSPDNCWAIRQGKTYQFRGSLEDVPCKHIEKKLIQNRYYYCILLQAQNDLMGILYLEGIVDKKINIEAMFKKYELFITTLSEQISLTVANLRLREILKVRSLRDPLTDLYNRAYLAESFERELLLSKRKTNPFAVVMMDVDHFKQVNDKYGHEAGDMVLQKIAEIIKQNIRRTDVACRYGGEEFLFLLYETPKDEAIARIEQLRTKIQSAEYYFDNKNIGPVTASFGLAIYPNNGESAEVLIDKADKALYESKKNGRNRLTVVKQLNES